MRWLADECVDAALVASLRSAGHDVSYVAEVASGLTDEEALRLAQDQQRVFLTEDKDFGELVFRFRLPVPAVVLLRINPTRASPQMAPARSRDIPTWKQAPWTLRRHHGNPIALASFDVAAASVC